jgi:hypothetical protein
VKSTNKENPKPKALAALREVLEADGELWRSSGDMARRTLDHLLRTYYSQSAYVQECVKRQVDEMREQLGYLESSSLERILIDQILVSWVNLYVLEINSASKLCESHSRENGLYWDRRLTGAQRRFRRASECLARIRKLSRNTPRLQFNIAASGGQQLNVAQ